MELNKCVIYIILKENKHFKVKYLENYPFAMKFLYNESILPVQLVTVSFSGNFI